MRYVWTLPFEGRLGTDANGNVLVAAGFDRERDMDPTNGVDIRIPVSGGAFDIFLTKLTANGNYHWTYSVGGAGDDAAWAGVGADRYGDVYIAGSFQRTVDFDVGPAADVHESQTTYDFLSNAFVTKLSATGDYLWTRSFNLSYGLAGAAAISLAVRDDGELFLTGVFGGVVDFDPGSGETLRSGDNAHLFVARFDRHGALVWIQNFGGPAASGPSQVLLDGESNVYVLGIFLGTVDFDPGPGTDYRTVQRIRDNVFVTKLSPDGEYLGAVTYPLWDAAMAVTPDGGVVLTGGFYEPIDFDPTDHKHWRTPRPAQPGGDPTSGLFVNKLGADFSHEWTYTPGSSRGEFGMAVVVDPSGDIVISGSMRPNTTLDFDDGPGVHEVTCPENSCDFLLRLRSDGSFVSVQLLPSSSSAIRRNLAVDPFGNVLVSRALTLSLHQLEDVDPTCEEDIRPFGYYVTKLSCASRDADFDADGRVDLFDLAAYQNCFTGPAIDGEGSIACSSGCDVFDLRSDSALDLADYVGLFALLSGP